LCWQTVEQQFIPALAIASAVSVHIMKKNLTTLIIAFFLSLTVKATGQAGDIIIWNGDTLTLFSNPLESHPDWENLSVKLNTEIENQKCKSLFSTANWRGYVAEWTIIADKIYLTNIYTCHDKPGKINLKKLFAKKGLIFADWVSAKLIVPKGECIEFGNLYYNSIFETEITLEFKDGVLLESKTYNNYIARKSKFWLNAYSTSYLNFIYTQINWDKLPDLKDKHIQVFVGIQPNQDGQIDSLLTNYTNGTEFGPDTTVIITDRNNIFMKEAIRIAELIPDWDVIYQRGLIVSRSLMITFDDNMKKKYAR
jgi:hypothetical protein